jgi:dTDP-4-amino-4,6-dideoxygalactose transaminase
MGPGKDIPFLDLSFQTEMVASQFILELTRLVEQNRFIGGRPVEAFEEAFASYCGVPYCIGLNSGTDALRLSLLAAGIEPEDEVITSPFSFIATAEAISQTSILKLVDVDLDTFALSSAAVNDQITSKTRAVVPVHIFGLPSNMTAFRELSERFDLFLLEDACQAHGAAIGNRRAGSLGDAAAFSFYPSKNLGAFGDAGAVTCWEGGVAERLRLLRNHGQVGSYLHHIEGFNSRMDTFQSIVLGMKLDFLEGWNCERRKVAKLYTSELADLEEVRFQGVPSECKHVYHVFAILAERRDELQNYLQESGIETRVIYPIPIHLNPAYKHLDLGRGDLPNAETIADSILCLPIYPGLDSSRIGVISEQIRRFYGKA